MVTYAQISPNTVNPRDIAGSAEGEESIAKIYINNNGIEKRNSRIFTIFSLRRELSPTCIAQVAQTQSCATNRALKSHAACHVPLGTKGQLSTY